MFRRGYLAALGALVLVLGAVAATGPFDWMKADNYDEIIDKMDAVTPENCKSKPKNELMLNQDTVAQLPQINKLLSTTIYPNRTALLHLHNMALNRAFFYSYIYQKLNTSTVWASQPGLMYMYFSAGADVSANPYNINGSAIHFDNNCSFANWYTNLLLNSTLPLFGARAWRFDDYNEPVNWLREPTNNTINMEDYGAGLEKNYTDKAYKINEWYEKWLPDFDRNLDSVRKVTYDVGIRYSNVTGQFIGNEFMQTTFFGPPSPGQRETEILPVLWTKPYYDCGRSNKWILSSVAPVIDHLPRYLKWLHLRRHRFVAVSVQDIDFLAIDINPCPIGLGNAPPNYFAGTARCKPTTMCEPHHGWGYKRGGYQCVCRPGYRYPLWQNEPFQGIDIERATEKEYKEGFDCVRVGWRKVVPVIEQLNRTMNRFGGKKKRSVELGPLNVEETRIEKNEKVQVRKKRFVAKHKTEHVSENQAHKIVTRETREKKKIVARHAPNPGLNEPQKSYEELHKAKLAPRYKRDVTKLRRTKRSFDQATHDRMEEILDRKNRINGDNCGTFKDEELQLPGDVSYGARKQFSPQARTALRLAHFLSNFLQNVDFYEEYGNLRADNLLNVDQIFGEVLANVMGDYRVLGSGVFFDRDKYRGPDGNTKQFFGPYAWRTSVSGTRYLALDYAGFEKHYLDDVWFKNIKERWVSNTYGLQRFVSKPMIRSDLDGTSLKKFEFFPMYYYAPHEDDGLWSLPYFDCDGYINNWVLTYSVPFFGLNSLRTHLEFKGVVIMDVMLDLLDIDQCPGEFHVPNAFKNTARCHFESSYCVALPGKRFTQGGYKCECKQGYEYPFNDRAWFFDGQTLEEEWRKKQLGIYNRFNTLKCRVAGAPRIVSGGLVLITTIMSFIMLL